MAVTVRNRDLGEITVHAVTYSPYEGATLIAFRSEAGELMASLDESGSLIISDPAYPKLRFQVERFRPLLEEALTLWPPA